MNRRVSKLYALGVLALAFLLVLSAPAFANEVKGTLTSIEPDNHLFTMTDEGGDELSFRLRVDGGVQINGEERHISDLQSGDQVTVTYELDDKEMVATLVVCTRD
jgi:hypothetical protein